MKKVAVIGGGINGVMTAWEAAKVGHQVDLFERGGIISSTSKASTKLLHGGLRYLEYGKILLVREALAERAWWLNVAPHLTNIIKLILPFYVDSPRPIWKIKIGMMLYDRLAGRFGIGKHRWVDADEISRLIPKLKMSGLQGGYPFFDGQMDDYALGCWAAEQAQILGVKIHDYSRVNRITDHGIIEVNGFVKKYDKVVNVAGPWAVQLLKDSGLPHKYNLDLVRGSHLLLDRVISCGVMFQNQMKNSLVFVLPYKGKTLLGTTEVRQSLNEPIECSKAEADQLIEAYNMHFEVNVKKYDVISSFAGVRPLIYSNKDSNRASREYKIEKCGKLINVYGGKWTTSRSLAKKIVSKIK